MSDYEIKDINLAEHGRNKINWAWQYMPSLQFSYNKYRDSQPFKGATIAACLHLEAKTANLLITLKKLGATVAACGSNPRTTYALHSPKTEYTSTHIAVCQQMNTSLTSEKSSPTSPT